MVGDVGDGEAFFLHSPFPINGRTKFNHSIQHPSYIAVGRGQRFETVYENKNAATRPQLAVFIFLCQPTAYNAIRQTMSCFPCIILESSASIA